VCGSPTMQVSQRRCNGDLVHAAASSQGETTSATLTHVVVRPHCGSWLIRHHGHTQVASRGSADAKARFDMDRPARPWIPPTHAAELEWIDLAVPASTLAFHLPRRPVEQRPDDTAYDGFAMPKCTAA